MDLWQSFSELLCEQGDIASDMVFTMVLLHFKGLGLTIFRQFCRKNGVDHEPYKTTFLELDFSGILSKMYQNWDPKGGGRNLPKSIENPLWTAGGPPGVPLGFLKPPRPPK